MSALPTPRRHYITEFDALRFFAAILTVAYHTQVVKLMHHAPGMEGNYNLDHVGSHCVTFFFVLSGFLITWLLFRERDKAGAVDIRAFYLRRIFRIWPLYYLIMLSGLFLFPNFKRLIIPPFWYHLKWHAQQMGIGSAMLWLTFFPNLAKVFVIDMQTLVSHTWSIGMEEQFYAGWPWLFRVVRKPVYAMLALLGVYLAARFVLYGATRSFQLKLYITYFRFDCMAGGGLLAWLYYSRKGEAFLSILTKPPLLYTLAFASLAATLLPDCMDEVYYTPFLISLYGCFLLALGMQPGRMPWLNHPVLRYLGQISYGIYMYNLLACFLAFDWVYRLGGIHLFMDASLITNIAYISGCLGITLGFSILSYRYLESPFLRLKDRLAQP